MFSWGASTPQEIEMLDRVEEEPDSIEALPDDMGRRGQILWIRGLTRLQHQVGTPHYSHDYIAVVRVVAFVISHVIEGHGTAVVCVHSHLVVMSGKTLRPHIHQCDRSLKFDKNSE